MVLDHEYDGVRHIETGNGMVFSGGYEGMIKAWDLETGEFLQALEGHTARITKIQVGVGAPWMVHNVKFLVQFNP